MFIISTVCARGRGHYEVQMRAGKVKNKRRETQLLAGKVKSTCQQMHLWALGLKFFNELERFGQSPSFVLKSKKNSGLIS